MTEKINSIAIEGNTLQPAGDKRSKGSFRISIIIPTCQGAQFLQETLHSILNQSRLPDELIISDDGSDDETKNIIFYFSKLAKFSVYWYDHVPSGITDNYLNAVKKASGDIIIIADQDDVWSSERISIVEKFFSDNPAVVVASSDSLIVDEYNKSLGRTLRGNPTKSINLSNKINNGNDFVEYLKGGLPLLAHTLSFRSIIKAELIRKPDYISNWWFEEWVSCVGVCLGRLGFIPDALTLYRQHSKNTAGEPRSNIFVLGRSQTQDLRIKKMEYLLSMISANDMLKAFDRDYKKNVLNNYIKFLVLRKKIREQGDVRSFINASKALADGRYRDFSKGSMSFWLDLMHAMRRS